MDDRTRICLSAFALGTALLTASCGFNQQARFQMSFLPPAPRAASPGDLREIDAPPDVQSQNPYLQQMPALFPAAAAAPKQKLIGDTKARQADFAFQRGQRYYKSKDTAAARREFDAAIDLMLDASDENPEDRDYYENKLEEMVDNIHRYDLAGLGASADIDPGRFEKAPLEDILPMTFPVDPKMKDKVREQVAATVSQLPLSVNDTVLGYISYFSNRGHRTLIAATERSGRYRPMIQRILDEEGVPQELIHLAQAESGFMPRAVSRKAAGGMWQFLMSRGQQYGLMQSRYADDRMDPEKATRAAARHLRDLYSEFGDWYLAIAAYNCGPGVVEKAVERTGYADFWELRSRGVIPAETTNYVPIILAMTIMEKNAAEYGLDHIQLDPPLEYDTVEVTAPTSLTLVADVTDSPLSELAALNPSILRGIAPASFSLHLPKGTGNQLVAALQLIPAEHRDSWRVHRVGAGETLAAIGKRYALPASSIVAANNLKTPEAVEGDRLMIPTPARAEAPARKVASRSAVRRTASSQRTGGTKRKAPMTLASVR